MPHPMDYRQQAPLYNDTPATDLFITPGATVTEGDLLTLYENGRVAPTDVAMGTTLALNTTAGVSAVTPHFNWISSAYGTANINSHGRAVSALANESGFAFVYLGDGTTPGTNVNLSIATTQAGAINFRTTVATGTSFVFAQITTLASNRLLVYWGQNTQDVFFRVYNADGTPFTSAVTLPTINSFGTGLVHNFEQLRSGDLVFVAQRAGTTNLSFVRYSEAGVLQGTETVIEAASAPNTVMLLACANGDFVVKYFRSAATQAEKIVRYSSTGVIVGALTTIQTSANASRGYQRQSIIELSNGNIVFCGSSAATATTFIYVYSSALAQISALDITTTGSGIARMNVPLVTFGTGFAFACAAAANTVVIGTFNASGVQLQRQNLVATPSPFNGSDTDDGWIQILYNLGPSLLFINSAVNTTGPTYQVAAVQITPIYNGSIFPLVGSVLVLEASGGTYFAQVSAAVTASGVMGYFRGRSASSNINFGTYRNLRSTPIGIAKTSGVAGGSFVQVQTVGTGRINQNFGAFGNFDSRSNVVGAQRGTINGSSVILYGAGV